MLRICGCDSRFRGICHTCDVGYIMQIRLRLSLYLAFATPIAGTVMVFLVLDRHSHGESDSPRPFAIIMQPVSAIALVGARALLRRQGPLAFIDSSLTAPPSSSGTLAGLETD